MRGKSRRGAWAARLPGSPQKYPRNFVSFLLTLYDAIQILFRLACHWIDLNDLTKSLQRHSYLTNHSHVKNKKVFTIYRLFTFDRILHKVTDLPHSLFEAWDTYTSQWPQLRAPSQPNAKQTSAPCACTHPLMSTPADLGKNRQGSERVGSCRIQGTTLIRSVPSNFAVKRFDWTNPRIWLNPPSARID